LAAVCCVDFADRAHALPAAPVSDCVLGANLADSNPHRWKAHESTLEDWVAALEADHLEIAIFKPGSTLAKAPAMRRYLNGTFPGVDAVWDDPCVGYVEPRLRAR
jgi:hypothetical protein